jgi:hypothetical protein
MKRSFAVLLSWLLFAVAVVHGQVREAWVSRFDGPASGDDELRAMVVDGAGNVYVTGSTATSETGLDYLTLKYDSDGNLIWAVQYDGPASGDDVATAIALDSQRNAFVTGYSPGIGTNRDYATIKYDPDGNEIWLARYDGEAHGFDIAWAITADHEGNAYVTGESYTVMGGTAAVTIKYSPKGDQIWLSSRGGTETFHVHPYRLAVSLQGNLYLAGSWLGLLRTNAHFYVFKVDSIGSFAWSAMDVMGGFGRGRAILVDAAENAYFGGEARGRSAPSGGYPIMLKLTTDGALLWRIVDEMARGYASEMAFDSSGNVVVCGALSVANRYKYMTMKLTPDGNQLWSAQYDGPGDGNDEGRGMAVDSEDNVYVTGFSSGIGGLDFATVKYDTYGNELWVARYDGPASGDDRAVGIAVSCNGDVYVGGTSTGIGTGSDFTVVKYTQDRQFPRTECQSAAIGRNVK